MVGVARGSGGSGVIPVCARMAGRASGRGSENNTRPLIRNGGALTELAVQHLERSMERMKDLENVTPQKVAPLRGRSTRRVSSWCFSHFGEYIGSMDELVKWIQHMLDLSNHS